MRGAVLSTRWMFPPKDGAHYIIKTNTGMSRDKNHIDVVMRRRQMADIARWRIGGEEKEINSIFCGFYQHEIHE